MTTGGPGNSPDITARATQFVTDLLEAVRSGGDVTSMTTDIEQLGAKAITAVTRAAAASATGGPSDTTADTTADALATLRGLTATLAPTGDLADPAVADRYFDRYRAAQATLADVLDALRLGREHLDREDARLADVVTTVRTAVTALTRYAALAAGIDEGIAGTASLAGTAEQTRQDLLYAVRQRRQDLLTQTAVAEQLVAALSITHRNTVELAAAVRRAIDCTLAALGAAVAAASAISSRRLVLDRIAAIDDATGAAVRAAAAVRAGTGTSLELDGDPAAALTAAFAELDTALAALDRTALDRTALDHTALDHTAPDPTVNATDRPVPTSGAAR